MGSFNFKDCSLAVTPFKRDSVAARSAIRLLIVAVSFCFRTPSVSFVFGGSFFRLSIKARWVFHQRSSSEYTKASSEALSSSKLDSRSGNSVMTDQFQKRFVTASPTILFQTEINFSFNFCETFIICGYFWTDRSFASKITGCRRADHIASKLSLW